MAERRIAVKDSSNLSRVNPANWKDNSGRIGDEADPAESLDMMFSEDLPPIDSRWIIDPSVILLGPKIAEGGHSKVYEGIYRSSSIAVKIVQAGNTLEEQEKRRKRFLREISMLSRVQHQNLVKFIGVCKKPNMVIATELLRGGSLKKFLVEMRPNRLDLSLAVGFALDISHAMECLHANGIIHRDLKPDNLLLTEDKKGLKLADFGLAREETVTEMMTAETGTYRWMAPELYSTVTLKDKKHYTHKVDIYSFAIVLWELITNRMPFERMSNLQAAYASGFKKTRPPLNDIPEELVAILERCWAEDPLVRPEFKDINSMLSSFLSVLQPTCLAETTPPEKVEISDHSVSGPYPFAVDSPGTRHLMSGQSRHGEEGTENGASSPLLRCFGSCFS